MNKANRSLFMLRHLLNFIYPPRCAGCDRRLPVESAARVCSECLASIERLDGNLCECCGTPHFSDANAGAAWCAACLDTPPHFTAARAITRYRASDEETAVVPSLIRRHKYGRDQSLCHALAECLGASLPLPGDDYDCIVPVPLHPARLRWRGFNQAALLGAAVARRIDRPLRLDALIRRRATETQTAKERRERYRNVRDAFAAPKPGMLVSRRILLIDDVMTTGATADECARTLLAAGARRVDVLALARVL